MRMAASRSRFLSVSFLGGRIVSSWSADQVTVTSMLFSTSTRRWTSSILGTPLSVVVPLLRSAPARIATVAFLEELVVMVPESLCPPSICKFVPPEDRETMLRARACETLESISVEKFCSPASMRATADCEVLSA